jgi:hypothetical protein
VVTVLLKDLKVSRDQEEQLQSNRNETFVDSHSRHVSPCFEEPHHMQRKQMDRDQVTVQNRDIKSTVLHGHL